MKKGIGLFFLLLSFPTLAGSTGVLVLRARVPASYSIKMEKNGDQITPVVHSNGARITPKVTVSFENNLRIVSVVHP